MESGLFVRRTGRNRFGSRYRCSLLCLRKYGICRWQREEIQVLPSMPQCWVVLVKPRMSVSTRTVFREVDTQAIQHQDIHGLAEAIREQDYQQMIKNGKQFRRYNGKAASSHPSNQRAYDQVRSRCCIDEWKRTNRFCLVSTLFKSAESI